MSITVTFIGSGHNASPTPTISLPSYNQPAGDCIVVTIGLFGTSAAPTISDTAGNKYQNGNPGLTGIGGTNSYYIWLFFCPYSIANATNVIVVNTGITSGFSTAFAWDVSGVDTGVPLVAFSSGTSPGGTTTPIVPSFSTPTGDAPPFVTFIHESVLNGFATASAPVIGGVSVSVDGQDGNGGDEGAVAHNIFLTGQTNITAQFTLSPSAPWAMLAATFGTVPKPFPVPTTGFPSVSREPWGASPPSTAQNGQPSGGGLIMGNVTLDIESPQGQIFPRGD